MSHEPTGTCCAPAPDPAGTGAGACACGGASLGPRPVPRPDGLDDVDLLFVYHTVSSLGRGRASLIPILQALQAHYNYLPEAALRRVCELTEITPAAISGVSSFFPRFRRRPAGRHIISVCHGTACHVKGAERVTEAFRRHLRLAAGDTDEAGGDTTADGQFTLQRVDCLGCCTLAPAVQIDGVTYGHLEPDGVARVLKDFLELQRRGALQAPGVRGGAHAGGPAEIRVGVGSCCIAGGSMDVLAALEDAVRLAGAPVVIKPVGCVGMCHQTPLVEVAIPGQEPATYARMRADDAREIVLRHFSPRGALPRARAAVARTLDCILTDEAWEPVTRYALDARDAPVCAFLGPQQHIATELYGTASPTDLDEYLEHGGFEALQQCRAEMTPLEIIGLIEESGLRGRGGAGFPTGKKWRLVHDEPGPVKYVICNGDEGDPGAFMDRMLLESYPYRILEGLAITARAVGATEAVLYIRAEYPLAVERVQEAIERCNERGLLQDASDGLSLRIVQGAGAFVCGEETGLIASLEGRRGSPRLRPPYPAQSGLWGRPTCVNNVETLALVPWIIRNGPAAFAALGTERSKGTKVFSLTGKVQRGGLIEVPMGISIGRIVEEIGGGVAPGRTFKAVQIGGPSGGCIPASLSDTPVDYEALTAAGAIMGSGGLVVMDDTDCMVDVARYFLEFTQRESCGKCTLCRVGTRRMLDIMDLICRGEGRPVHLEKLEELGRAIKVGSLCALGQTAPNPVLSTLAHFREEYEAHLEGRCPAGKCRALTVYRITDACIGCVLCARHCPGKAIAPVPHQQHEIDPSRCVHCDTCRQVCPVDAVVVE